MISYKLSAKILFLIKLGVGVLQTVLLLWSFFLPLEVPLKLLFFFIFLLFLFAVFCVHCLEHLYLQFSFFHDEYKSYYLLKKKDIYHQFRCKDRERQGKTTKLNSYHGLKRKNDILQSEFKITISKV